MFFLVCVRFAGFCFWFSGSPIYEIVFLVFSGLLVFGFWLVAMFFFRFTSFVLVFLVFRCCCFRFFCCFSCFAGFTSFRFFGFVTGFCWFWLIVLFYRFVVFGFSFLVLFRFAGFRVFCWFLVFRFADVLLFVFLLFCFCFVFFLFVFSGLLVFVFWFSWFFWFSPVLVFSCCFVRFAGFYFYVLCVRCSALVFYLFFPGFRLLVVFSSCFTSLWFSLFCFFVSFSVSWLCCLCFLVFVFCFAGSRFLFFVLGFSCLFSGSRLWVVVCSCFCCWFHSFSFFVFLGLCQVCRFLLFFLVFRFTNL